jgi:thymidylate synthase (FAD)
MDVTYIDHMGSDLTVVNAARVSFNKESENIDDKDIKLIKYLAKHKHWSPFSHCFIQFRIEAPLFVARQLIKHQVGLAWNEVSRRYVDTMPRFYTPTSWRTKADNVKL